MQSSNSFKFYFKFPEIVESTYCDAYNHGRDSALTDATENAPIRRETKLIIGVMVVFGIACVVGKSCNVITLYRVISITL